MLVKKIEVPGMDGCDGAPYCGSGCFHRRESLCGVQFSRNYKGKLNDCLCNTMKDCSVHELEQGAKLLANCSYEKGTQWGKEVSLALSLFTHMHLYRNGSVIVNLEGKTICAAK